VVTPAPAWAWMEHGEIAVYRLDAPTGEPTLVARLPHCHDEIAPVDSRALYENVIAMLKSLTTKPQDSKVNL
jgi:hypothetical protein